MFEAGESVSRWAGVLCGLPQPQLCSGWSDKALLIRGWVWQAELDSGSVVEVGEHEVEGC